MIAMAPLRVLATLFQSFLSTNKKVATPLVHAYQVPLHDAQQKNAVDYECRVPTAGGGRVGSMSVDAFMSLETSGANATCYHVQLHDSPQQHTVKYECRVPTACSGSLAVEASPMQASPADASPADASPAEASPVNASLQTSVVIAQTEPTVRSANPYLVIFSESPQALPSDSFLV